MLDYIDNYVAVFTLWVTNAIEFSGLLHGSYFVQIIVCLLAGSPVESNEPPRSVPANLFFWGRILFSLVTLSFCVAVTMVALFTDRTTIWEGLPPVVALLIFILLVCIVGMLEGMQIAFFAVAKLKASEHGDSYFAMKT